MNLLVLVNHGPGFPQYFYNLGRRLQDMGHEVHYALDSELPLYEEPRLRQEALVHIFSQYRRTKRAGSELPPEYSDLNLWEMLFSDIDRFEWYGLHRDKRLPWYQSLAADLFGFFAKVMQANRIERVIYEPVSNSFSDAAYHVGRRANIGYTGIAGSRLPGRFELHSSPFGVRERLAKIFQRIVGGELDVPPAVDAQVNSYLCDLNEIAPDYMKTNALDRMGLIEKYWRADKLRLVLRRLKFVVLNDSEDFPYTLGNPFMFSAKQFIKSIKRKWRSPSIRRLYSPPAADDTFFLYPLHFHPEASTSVLARHFVDEVTTIRNIAFNLPFGAYLYVKDHVSAHANWPKRIYREIASLPNVKLIDAAHNAKTLARRSRGVITLTSTLGYEALVMGIPVICLGNAFYDFHPLCVRLSDWDALFEALRSPPPQVDAAGLGRDLAAALFLATEAGDPGYHAHAPTEEVLASLAACFAEDGLLASS